MPQVDPRNDDAARALLIRADAMGASRLPEKVALYESGLALYPDDPELVAQLSFRLAQTFFRDKAYRLAIHRLGEALRVAKYPSPELLKLKKQLDAVDLSKAPVYPEAFVRIGAPEFRRITYSVERLWQLEAPVRQLPRSNLEFHLSLPYWATPGKHFNLSPQEVIQDPAAYPHEYHRIVNTDLAHPIDVCHWKGKWMMLDGLHRLAKLKMLGQKNITVRDIPLDLLKSISTVFEG